MDQERTEFGKSWVRWELRPERIQPPMVAQKDELMLGLEEWGSRGILQLTENFLATETVVNKAL